MKKMYQVVGAAMVVYNELGNGLSEQIYQECLSIISERYIFDPSKKQYEYIRYK